MKRLMAYTAVVLATLLGLVLLWQFRLIVLVFILSLFLTAAVRPLTERLAGRGFSRALAALLIYVLGIAAVVLLLSLAGEQMLDELNELANRSVVRYELAYREWVEQGLPWQQALAERLPPRLVFTGEEGPQIEALFPVLATVAQNVVGALAGLAVVLALSVYWSADQNRFERLWLSLLPAGRRVYARDGWREMEEAVGTYIRSQTVQSVAAAVLLVLAYAGLGIEYPLSLALFAALAAFVPLFGGVATAFLAFMAGSGQGPLIGWAALVITLLVFLGLKLLVEPYLERRRARSYMLTALAIIPLVDAFGLLGLIGAPPLAAVLEVLAGQLFRVQTARRESAVQLDVLETRYQQMAMQAQNQAAEAISPELRSLLERLESLLQETRKINPA